MTTGQPTETDRYTRPDAPPPDEDEEVRSGVPAEEPPAATTGSEATSTVAHGTGRETGEAKEQRGDTVDGSEGSATGSRTSR